MSRAVTETPVSEWQKKLPMRMTYARIFITVPVVLCMFSPTLTWRVISVLLFGLAAITDYYDGYFARKFNATSNLGKFMDPIADKILVTSVLTVLLYFKKIDPFMAMIIFARDNFISGLRSAAAADQLIIDAKNTGKWKTGVQMLGLPMLMIGNFHVALLSPLVGSDGLVNLELAGYLLLWIGVVFSVWSGAEYFLMFLGRQPR